MTKKEEVQLTEGSKYKIYSIGGRENAMENKRLVSESPRRANPL